MNLTRSALPANWSDGRCAAFERLLSALMAYETYAAVLQRVGSADATDAARRDELRAHIVNVLLPAFRGAA